MRMGGMTNFHADRDTLRVLADDGNEKALDLLAELADSSGDVDELSELLDEGCMRAGQLLTRRAVAVADLLELQRVADSGYEPACDALDQLLALDQQHRRSRQPGTT